jgi:hypothetical protein
LDVSEAPFEMQRRFEEVFYGVQSFYDEAFVGNATIDDINGEIDRLNRAMKVLDYGPIDVKIVRGETIPDELMTLFTLSGLPMNENGEVIIENAFFEDGRIFIDGQSFVLNTEDARDIEYDRVEVSVEEEEQREDIEEV